jgi:phosphate uptake regulator
MHWRCIDLLSQEQALSLHTTPPLLLCEDDKSKDNAIVSQYKHCFQNCIRRLGRFKIETIVKCFLQRRDDICHTNISISL